MELRVLRSGPGHPTYNMGLDEALLLSVDAPPTLRLYRWEPHGLSLGYFQSRRDFAAVPGDYVVVRRLTGGGAILHGDELTFSLALDATRLPGDVAQSYDLIHRAVGRALAEIGVATRPGEDSDKAGLQPLPEEPWCFADPTEQDLVTAGGKLLGSAQRRIRRPVPRVLHHGSLVLRAPRQTPFCGSVAEFVNPETVATRLEDAMITHLATALRLQPREGEPSAAETQLAMELATSRYGDAEFTNRR